MNDSNTRDYEGANSQLSELDQQRLAEILDAYLIAIEQGSPIEPAELLKRHPDDADQLEKYLSGLNVFHAVAVESSSITSPSMKVVKSLGLDQASAQKFPPKFSRTIGDFQLLSEIGRGGMGVVYDAYQTSLGRPVALKVLPFTSIHHAKQIQRFKNEARAAASIEHPNIVPIYTVYSERITIARLFELFFMQRGPLAYPRRLDRWRLRPSLFPLFPSFRSFRSLPKSLNARSNARWWSE